MLCPPVYITQAGGGVLAVAHITCATPSSVKRDSPVLPTRLLPAGLNVAYGRTKSKYIIQSTKYKTQNK